MIAQTKIKQVQEMVAGLTREEIIWLSGYLSGLAGAETSLLAAEGNSGSGAATVAAVQKITIAYGTETGNAKKLATSLAAKAKKKGIQPKLVSLDQYKPTDLQKEEWFFTIISTQGEGEPPAAAKKFYDYVHQDSVQLSKLNFGVLALGDTAYPLFCKAGEDVDSQLQKLGGKRILPLQKLDTDYEEEAEQWIQALLDSLLATAPVTTITTAAPKKAGKKTYTGVIQTKVNLNGRGSQKETYHIEIAAEDVVFEPGDAVGIVPKNKPELVQKIMDLSGLTEDVLVPYRNETTPLGLLLHKKLSLVNLSERVVKQYAEIVKQEIPATRMDFSDLLRIYPISNSDQFLAALQILDPISPRLYSIASSPEAHAGEVHLTLGMHRFCVNELMRDGLCSYYLSQLNEEEEIDFYIHKNHLFKLPAADKDAIMIGPGTGIAPFRSFVAHRDATGAEGRNWVFFGDQHFTTDFLYQTEWQNWLETGVLTRMNVAFSRDQDEKIYVQHKLWQQRKELVAWIDSGAYVYICGAKEPMSVDVENMLVKIFSEEKGLNAEDALELMNALKEEGRYLKDVY